MISSFPKVTHGLNEPSTTAFSNTKAKNIEIQNDTCLTSMVWLIKFVLKQTLVLTNDITKS